MLTLIFCVLLLFAGFAATQDLPKEIRGYKVYNAKISVRTDPQKTSARDNPEVFVRIGEPELTDVSFSGVTLNLPAEIKSIEQSGTIDFLTFSDFQVNNVAVEVEEYKNSFEFKKNQLIKLPKPIKISIGARQTLRGALSELIKSKDVWTVTGRVFVFGRFKKSFLKFKRVVPVEINLQIENPFKVVSN